MILSHIFAKLDYKDPLQQAYEERLHKLREQRERFHKKKQQQQEHYTKWLHKQLECLHKRRRRRDYYISLSQAESVLPRREKRGENIFVLTTGNAASSSAGTSSILIGGNHHRRFDVIYDPGATFHATGDLSIFIEGTLEPANATFTSFTGQQAIATGVGDVCFQDSKYVLHKVYYCPGMVNMSMLLVSGQELDRLGYRYEFERGQFVIMNPWTRKPVGEGVLLEGRGYILDYLHIPPYRISVPQERPSQVNSLWKAWSAVRASFDLRASRQAPHRPPV